MNPIEVYRRDAADADKERRRRKSRLSYDEKLVILQKLRRAADAIQTRRAGGSADRKAVGK